MASRLCDLMTCPIPRGSSQVQVKFISSHPYQPASEPTTSQPSPSSTPSLAQTPPPSPPPSPNPEMRSSCASTAHRIRHPRACVAGCTPGIATTNQTKLLPAKPEVLGFFFFPSPFLLLLLLYILHLPSCSLSGEVGCGGKEEGGGERRKVGESARDERESCVGGCEVTVLFFFFSNLRGCDGCVGWVPLFSPHPMRPLLAAPSTICFSLSLVCVCVCVKGPARKARSCRGRGEEEGKEVGLWIVVGCCFWGKKEKGTAPTINTTPPPPGANPHPHPPRPQNQQAYVADRH